MKKGVELTLNTMIIAVILLVVAVIIIAIFTGGIKNIMPWFTTTSSCTGQGYECKAKGDCSGAIVKGNCAADQYCCLKLNEKT